MTMGSMSGRKSALFLAAFAGVSAFASGALAAGPDEPSIGHEREPLAASMPILVEYVTPAECPSPDAFSEMVREEIARAPSVDRSWRFSVRFAPTADGYVGILKTESGERTLSGPTCENVAAALATVIAIAAPPPEPALPVAPPARAEPAPVGNTIGLGGAHPAIRFSLAATAGGATFIRTAGGPSSEGGIYLGGELRVHPYGPHGLLLAYAESEGIFGPHVSLFDLDYSLRVVAGRALHGVTGAVYFDLGPSVGYVRQGGPDHFTVGGRVGAAADVYFGNVALGAVAAGRLGVPLSRPGMEQALTLGLRLGFAWDAFENTASK
jgi:hypothetical protein